ncbi:head-tail connector protein [Palleronia rufa]|uniref:head-tail connector protein n=1 Tax=Palleronia rufa TaxID=1530186 RepID=UPI00056A6815|nr:hypothetical protein [Palleronia rufa]
MYLVEQTGLDGGALPLAELRAHLRLGRGFADTGLQDPVLERALKAAIAQVEAATGKAVIARGFVWTVNAWRDMGRQVLPRAPLVEMTELAIIGLDGTRDAIALDRIHVTRDAHRPALVAKGFVLPPIPVGGRAEVTFRAGFADDWAGVPNDLSLAILSLAAGLYEDRLATGDMPKGIRSLLAPYRQPRFFGGL